MLDRLVGFCFTLLVVAVAIAFAVHVVEAVWTALVSSVAVIGALVVMTVAVRLWWRRHSTERW